MGCLGFFKADKLPEIDSNFLKGFENIEMITTTDSEYTGQMKNGEGNGKGRMRWFIEWKNGYRNGKGIYKYYDGKIYNGDLVGGDRNGWRTMQYINDFNEG